jgi:hypothetical protein
VEGQAIAYGELEEAIGGAKGMRLIIVDASRADPFAAKMVRRDPGSAIPRDLGAPPAPKPGSLVVFSAKDGQLTEDGDGGSPFARALAARLQTLGRDVRRVFENVHNDVMAATGNRQEPATYDALPADREFFFVPGHQGR